MTAGDAGSPGSAARGHLALVCACFLLSGLSALVFQVAWIEELTRVFGASQPAVAAVLAAYMGGLAAGAGIAARWLLPRLGRPILAYAWIELAIGASALAVPFMVDAAARLQAAVFESGARGPGFAMVFSLAVAFLVLIVPTSLMGATLPILARFVITAEEHIGSRIGALYTTNTLGGALGAWGAAFFLMPSLGLELTVLVAVSINGIVGLLAALAHFLAGGAAAGGPIEEPPERPLEPASPSSESGGGGGVWILPAILISGVISFTYEVLWTRLLSHLLGSSTYAFGTMLATFLVGLALGGAAGGRMARSREAARMQFAVTQVAIAAVSWAAFVNLDRLAGLQQVPFTGAVPGPPGALLCAATLLPGAFFIGATFPQAVRALAPSARGTAVASGRVLVWNTCGAIAGATGAGFLLLPALRFSGTLAACVAASLALAAAASLVERPRRKGWALGCLAGLAVFGSLAPPPPDSLIRSSPFSGGPRQGSLDFYAVGRTSTVTALGTAAGYRLSTDGLPEAVLQRPGALASRFSIARWLSLLPVAYRPDAESMLLVGLGGGLTVEEVPSTVRRIRVVELEAEVLLANRALAAKRRVDPLADPRVEVEIEDARHALALTRESFDIIASQPSHPWTSGAANLFTREFFALASERLTEDGVFIQWIGLRFIDEPLLHSLLATLLDVFPHLEVYQPFPQDALLFVGSKKPLDLEAGASRAIADAPREFAAGGVATALDLEIARMLEEGSAGRLAAGAPLLRDRRNLLRTRSPRLLAGSGFARESLSRLWSDYDPLDPPPPETALALIERLARKGADFRATRLATRLPEAADRSAAFALVDLVSGREGRAESTLRAALARGEKSPALLNVVLMQRGSRIRQGQGSPRLLARMAEIPQARLILEGWSLAGAGELAQLEALDGELAREIPREHVLHHLATRLRIDWRRRAGRRAAALEALELFDGLLTSRVRPADWLQRARLAVVADDLETGRFSLLQLQASLKGRSQAPRGIALLVGSLPPAWLEDPEVRAARDALRASLEP